MTEQLKEEVLNEEEVKETEPNNLDENSEPSEGGDSLSEEADQNEQDKPTEAIDLIEDLEIKLKGAEDKLLRLFAEFDNYRKRVAKDSEASMKYRSQSLVTELLPVLDNFERALKIESTSEEAKQLQQGMEMIHSQIIAAFNKEGVEAMDTVGKPFDPNFHQAIQQVNVPGHESGNVVEDFQKGYTIKDRVIRAAMVSVQE